MDKIYRKKQTNKIVIWGIILFGVFEIGLFRFVFPSYYTNYLLPIPFYFLILGISVLLVLSRMSRKKIHPGRAIARLMIFNIAQMMLSFIMMTGYYYYITTHKQIVLVAFSIYYIFFMGLKFFVLYNIDKQHKLAKKKQNNTQHVENK